MKAPILFRNAAFFVMMLLLVGSVSADLTDGVEYVLEFNNDLVDATGNFTFTGSIAAYSSTYKVVGSHSVDDTGAASYVNIPDAAKQTGTLSVSTWVRVQESVSDDHIWSDFSGGNFNFLIYIDNGAIKIFSGDGATYNTAWNTGETVAIDTWAHYVAVRDCSNNTEYFYLDGDIVASRSVTYCGGATAANNNKLMKSASNSNYYDGYLDQTAVWDRAITASEVSQLYNSGSGLAYSSWVAAPPTADSIEFYIKDAYNNAAITGANVTIYNASWSSSNTTDGSGYVFIAGSGTFSYNVTHPNYFDLVGAGTVSNGSIEYVNLTGAFPSFTVYDIEGTQLSNFTLTSFYTTNTTTGNTLKLLLPPNITTDINVTKNSFYVFESNYSSSSKDDTNNNFTGLYQSVVTINATNAYTGMLLSNFTGWIYNTVTGYNQSFNTTGNSTTINTILGNFTVYIDVFDYSISSANTRSLTVDNNTETLTFGLYSENSIFVTIRNELNNQLITNNVTITLTGNSTEELFYTATGTIFLENITDGNYTVKFEAGNYSLRTYSITVADRSTQNLNAYLSPSTDTVTFSILDFDNSQSLEGANIVMERLINSSWTILESKTSDITGRAQFTYTTGIRYRFTVSKDDYLTRVFDLDPIIFTSYVIQLTKVQGIDSNAGLFDVTIFYFPTTFINEENNTFTFQFGSTGGSLESYGYTATYPGGTTTNAGTNSNGQSFVDDFEITGAGFTDRVVITYWYDSTFGDNKTYTREFMIQDTADNGTLTKFNDDDFGMGTIEKILIAVICIILFAGVLTLFGNPILGYLGAFIGFSFFTLIGFLSLWVTIPSVLIIVLVAARGATR